MAPHLVTAPSWMEDGGGGVGGGGLHNYDDEDASGMDEDLARYGEDELIINALKVAGGDLWLTTRDLEASLRREETSAVEEYVRESAGVAELRLQIENCDGVLSVFEKMLEKCQSDLGNIAGGVRHMKERADAFEMLSKNRQRAETSVAGWIETAAIPRGLSKAIHDVDVGDALYCQHLKVLQDKLAFVAKYTKCGGDMPVSCANAAPLLRRLRARAVERICVHLKAEMRKLEDDNELLYALTLGQAGKADSNKVIYALTLGQAGGAALKQLHDRQHQLLRSSPLILFLISSSTDGDGGEEVYGQMLTQYTNTMGAALASQLRAEYRTYAAYGVRDCITCRHSLFPEIESEKGRMALIVSKGAVLGHAGLAAVKGMTQGIAQGVVGVSTGQLRQLRHFNPSTWDMGGQGSEADWMLGDRLEHMQGLTSVHHKDKEANNQEHQGKDANNQEQVSTHQPPELVLHRLLLSFGDLLDGESGIVCKLFPRRSGDELIGMFVPCVSGIREAAAQLIESTVDPVSLLLMALSLETSQRKICDVLCCDPGTGAAFDDFYMWGYMTVWPKFKMSVQAQVAAVRRAADTCLLSLPSHMAHVEAFIVRYAHLSGAFYVVDAQLETQSREMAGMSLKLMWSEVWLLTSTLSLQLPAANKRSIFILNQLHAILDVYYQLGVCSAACGPVRDKVRQEIERLLPLLLGQRYKALIALLAELEAAQLQPSRSSINVNAAVSVLMGFKEHWKMDAHTCSAFLTASCSRPQEAREVTKKCLSKFLVLYCRTCKMLVEHLSALEAQTVMVHIVPEQVLVADIQAIASPPDISPTSAPDISPTSAPDVPQPQAAEPLEFKSSAS